MYGRCVAFLTCLRRHTTSSRTANRVLRQDRSAGAAKDINKANETGFRPEISRSTPRRRCKGKGDQEAPASPWSRVRRSAALRLSRRAQTAYTSRQISFRLGLMRAATGIDEHEVCSGGTDMHRAKDVQAGTAWDKNNRPRPCCVHTQTRFGSVLARAQVLFRSWGDCQLGHAVEFDCACDKSGASCCRDAKPFQIVRRIEFILLGIVSTQSFFGTTRIVFAVSGMRIPFTQPRPGSRERKVSIIAPCKCMRTIRSPRFWCVPSPTAWRKLRQSKPDIRGMHNTIQYNQERRRHWLSAVAMSEIVATWTFNFLWYFLIVLTALFLNLRLKSRGFSILKKYRLYNR